jgi:hypothetical protein
VFLRLIAVNLSFSPCFGVAWAAFALYFFFYPILPEKVSGNAERNDEDTH